MGGRRRSGHWHRHNRSRPLPVRRSRHHSSRRLHVTARNSNDRSPRLPAAQNRRSGCTPGPSLITLSDSDWSAANARDPPLWSVTWSSARTPEPRSSGHSVFALVGPDRSWLVAEARDLDRSPGLTQRAGIVSPSIRLLTSAVGVTCGAVTMRCRWQASILVVALIVAVGLALRSGQLSWSAAAVFVRRARSLSHQNSSTSGTIRPPMP